MSMPASHLPVTDSDWTSAHQWQVRVYYEDTDAGGIVFYANYLKFLERARTEWLRSLGFSQARLAQEQSVIFVVSSLTIDYKRTGRLDDLLSVQSIVSQTRKASLHFEQRVVRDETVLVSAKVRLGCVNADSLQPFPLPDVLLQQITLTNQRRRCP